MRPNRDQHSGDYLLDKKVLDMEDREVEVVYDIADVEAAVCPDEADVGFSKRPRDLEMRDFCQFAVVHGDQVSSLPALLPFK